MLQSLTVLRRSLFQKIPHRLGDGGGQGEDNVAYLIDVPFRGRKHHRYQV